MTKYIFALCGFAACAASPDVDPFADRVVSFEPGEGAGFGQLDMPDVVLGAPHGKGPDAGSLHVLSLGDGGTIVLEFIDYVAVDEPGVDFIVFENAFPAWPEVAQVEVSEDGVEWHAFPCDTSTKEFQGCAGVEPVITNPDNGVDPTDPDEAGGDLFDLEDAGLQTARFVRITDAGVNTYDGIAGGFDLDAVAIVNGIEE